MGSRTIAYLAPDGARVEAGDVVVRFDPREAEQQAADGRDDLAAAQEKTRKAEVEGSRKQRSASLDQELAADALDKLERLGLATQVDGAWQATSLTSAISHLDGYWDSFFEHRERTKT